ncbi:hypothetical protein RCOM_1444500 [Ricinus communis]|uniref:phosphoribosyl-ATP diphosphatase n=1 Tax=Ricinus communis TaxID=3988 RepID=B9RGV5_RICCO|nr:hypothetical protein RCOM_1444500 [Ricinus communis]
MAISSLNSVQFLGCSSKNRNFFAVGDYNAKKAINFPLILASAKKSESKVETLLDSVKWDEKGLAVAIAQNIDTGAVQGKRLALTTLYSLESTISQRKAELAAPQEGKPSWTRRLLDDPNLLCSKIREEADELCRTLEENEHSIHTASEMGDVLYHAMVLLAHKDVKIEDVLDVLRQRFSQSGIDEKRSRKQQN